VARSWNPAYHPRGPNGRFTRSATRTMTAADKTRGRKSMEGFNPTRFADADAARNHLEQIGGDQPDGAVVKYLNGGWRTVNPALRVGKTADGVNEIDAAMRTLPDDLILRRQVPAALFAHIPLPDLVGMKVRDAAYASTTLDASGHESGADGVTMHIAAPKGTPAVVNAADGEILLARDTEVAITRVEPNGQGGWDVYGAVLAKAKKQAKPASPTGDGAGTKGDGPAAALDNRVRDLVKALATRDGGGTGDLVSLARLRDELPDVDRADVDAALLRLDRNRVIQLDPDPNRSVLTDRARNAAVPLGGEDMHLVSLVAPADSGGGGDRPTFGGDPLEATPIDLYATPRPEALTNRMYRALNGYRDDEYTAVNGQLRGSPETPTVTRQITAIDDTMQASLLTRDVQVFRGMADARSMFGDRVDGDLAGLRWREDGYLSTSTDAGTAQRFAEDGLRDGSPMLMQIVIPAGTPAVGMSGPEAELLVDRGTTVSVVRDRGIRDGIRVVDVEVLPKAAGGNG
jgi:hypothetical protein